MKYKKPNRFDRGVLFAVAELVRVFDQPTMAACIVREADLEHADIRGMDEYDRESLLIVNKEPGINFRAE